MANSTISEADSTTDGLNDPNEARELIFAFMRLQNHIKDKHFSIREYRQGSRIDQERFDAAFFIGCAGCGTQVKTLTLSCPNATGRAMCRESAIFFFKKR